MPRLARWGLARHAGLTLGGSAWGIRGALVIELPPISGAKAKAN